MPTLPLDPVIHKDLPQIIHACLENNVEAVRQCLDRGDSVYTAHEYHPSVAATASAEGYVEILKLLLEHGYDANHVEGAFGERLLHHITDSPRLMEQARLLLDFGADPNAKNKYSATPIQCAASSGNLEYMELLLAAGADPANVSIHGRDAFYDALLNGNLECIERLMSLGGDINAQDNRGKTVLSRYAMAAGDIEMIKWLLAHGADKSIPDDGDYTPLDWARENGHTEIVKLLE